MKPSLQFRLSQHLTLTPQLPAVDPPAAAVDGRLTRRIDRMLMENPALEREDAEGEPSRGTRARAGGRRGRERRHRTLGTPHRSGRPDIASSWRGPDDDDEGDRSFTRRTRRRCATTCAASSRSPISAIATAYSSSRDRRPRRRRLSDPAARGNRALLPAESERSRRARHRAQALQNWSPPAWGARPGECLALQLRIMPDEPARRLALDIVRNTWSCFASRDYTRLKNITGAGEERCARRSA